MENKKNNKMRIYAPGKNKAGTKQTAFDFTAILDEPDEIPRKEKPSKHGKKPPKESFEENAVAKEKSKKKKRAKKSKAQKGLTIAIAVVAFLACTSALYFIFSVKSFEVAGITRYTQKEIVALSGISYGKNMLLVDLADAKKRIEQDPYLKVKEIKRVLPDQVYIRINERKEAAAITYQNLAVIIDANGHVLSIGNRSDLTGLVQVKGMQAINYSINQRLGELTDFYVNTLIDILKALELHSLSQEIATLDISNPLNVHMTTKQGLDIRLGQAQGLDEKLKRLAAVLPELIKANVVTGTLHLSEKNAPVYSPPKAAEPSDPEEPQTPENPVNTPDPSATPDPENREPGVSPSPSPEE